MRSDDGKVKLIEEFPELAQPDALLQKEVYAHFGLVFMSFGLVEHSLINIITFKDAASVFPFPDERDQTGWGNEVDKAYASAVALTFGNLVKKVSAIPEFIDLRKSLDEAKRLRDYFAHHFMREESRFSTSDDGCWLLLSKIAVVRRQIKHLDEELKVPFGAMCQRLKIPLPSEPELEEELEKYHGETVEALISGVARVGWDGL